MLLRSSKSAERNISYNSATALKGSKQRDRVKQREREREREKEGDSGSGEAITKSILSNKEFLRSQKFLFIRLFIDDFFCPIYL